MADEQGYYQQQPPVDSRNRRERAPRQKKEKTPREKKVKAPLPPKPEREPREPRQKKEKVPREKKVKTPKPPKPPKAPREPRKSKNADPYGYYDDNAEMDKKKIIIPVVIIAVVAIIGFVLLSGGLPAISLPEGGGSTTGGDTSSSGAVTDPTPAPTTSPGNLGINVFHSGAWSGQYILNGQAVPYSGMGSDTIDLGVPSGSVTASFKADEGGVIYVDIIKYLDETKKKQSTIVSAETPDANGYVTAVANV
jgi:hypothetical protein